LRPTLTGFIFADGSRQERLDNRLPADVQTSSPFVKFRQHPLSQIDVDSVHRSPASERIREKSRDFASRRHSGDLLPRDRFLGIGPFGMALMALL
jgi:hypothetical protein